MRIAAEEPGLRSSGMSPVPLAAIGVGLLMYGGRFGPAPQNITIKMPAGN